VRTDEYNAFRQYADSRYRLMDDIIRHRRDHNDTNESDEHVQRNSRDDLYVKVDNQ
jgi:hypothetical protein